MTCRLANHYRHKRGFKLDDRAGCSCNWFYYRSYAGNYNIKIENRKIGGRRKNANPTDILIYKDGRLVKTIEEPRTANEFDNILKSYGLIKESLTINLVG